MAKIKVAFLMDGFSPYRVPFWRELAEHVALTVVLLHPIETGRHWKMKGSGGEPYALEVMRSRQIYFRSMDWALNLPTGAPIGDLLQRIAPDCLILGGWASPGYWQALWWARARSRPCMLWMESNTLSSRTQGNWLINILKRTFISRCAGFYVFGDVGAAYVAAFGAPPGRTVKAFNLPDIDLFANAPDRRDRTDDSEVQLLYAGQLIARKGVLSLPAALKSLRSSQWHLTIVGSGALEGELKDRFRSAGLLDRVTFTGLVSPDAMIALYGAADCLLFPSKLEVWGMVVHEALLSGVYVVGSTQAASVRELITPGENGELFSPEDSAALGEAIGRALQKAPFDRARIRRSVEHITVAGEVEKLRTLVAQVSAVGP